MKLLKLATLGFLALQLTSNPTEAMQITREFSKGLVGTLHTVPYHYKMYSVKPETPLPSSVRLRDNGQHEITSVEEVKKSRIGVYTRNTLKVAGVVVAGPIAIALAGGSLTAFVYIASSYVYIGSTYPCETIFIHASLLVSFKVYEFLKANGWELESVGRKKDKTTKQNETNKPSTERE